MAQFETWLTSDLQKMIKPAPLWGTVFSQDNQANLIGVRVYDGGEAATLGGSVSGKVIRADGATVSVSGTVSGNEASIVLPQAAYAVPGPIAIAISNVNGGAITTLAACTAYVTRTSTDTIVDPGTILPTIDTLIAQIDAAIASIPADYSALLASIAPTFSASTAYVAGQYVWYNGTLYRFTAAHSAGSWTGTDVITAALGVDVAAITERTKNLWAFGNQTFIKKVTLNNVSIEAGTYTISANIFRASTADVNINSRIIFYKNSVATGNLLANPFLPVNSGRQSTTFTLAENADIIVIYSSVNESQSSGVDASWQSIQLEYGEKTTPYVGHLSAIDYTARSILTTKTLMENQTYIGDDQNIDIVLPNDNTYQQTPIVSCDAMFTRSNGITDYPRVQILMNNKRNLVRNTTWYQAGKEGEYYIREWRAPAYQSWANNDVTIRIHIPTGCTLAIRKLWYRYDNSIDLVSGRGIKFFARAGTCNMVTELTTIAEQMAYRHGYDVFTVIPKISSDGVWFAYHDDTFDIATTSLRNADGSAITDTTYNGRYFNEIPFSYLDQLRYTTSGFSDLRIMKLETCFEYLAKTGMKLRFSMHPAVGINTISKLTDLKNLVRKYGLLKDLSIIVNDITSLFPVFRNDIGGYCFANSVGASWDGTDNRVDAALTKAQNAKETYGITVPISCGLWSDGLFSDRAKAEELVGNILEDGFAAGVFTYAFTGIDGATHSYLWSEDMRWLMSIGITEFTDGYNASVGLNW